MPVVNPDANGNAWFIKKLTKVYTSDQEIQSLKNLDTKNVAVINATKFPEINTVGFQIDSLATITLTNYEPNHLTYSAKNSNSGLAVFSEMYYANGWNAYIDGKLSSYFKVDYALRALEIPAGEHQIDFKFEPRVIRWNKNL